MSIIDYFEEEPFEQWIIEQDWNTQTDWYTGSKIQLHVTHCKPIRACNHSTVPQYKVHGHLLQYNRKRVHF